MMQKGCEAIVDGVENRIININNLPSPVKIMPEIDYSRSNGGDDRTDVMQKGCEAIVEGVKKRIININILVSAVTIMPEIGYDIDRRL